MTLALEGAGSFWRLQLSRLVAAIYFWGTTRIGGVQGRGSQVATKCCELVKAYIYGHAAHGITHARLCPCIYTRPCCVCSH